MSKIETILGELRTARAQTLAELSDITPDEFPLPADHPYWDNLRSVLLQMGNHLREHANQIEDTRRTTDRAHTMSQRMLAEAELSWGKLLGSVVGLTDDDITIRPPDGGWTIEEVLVHVTKAEKRYLQLAREARKTFSLGNNVGADVRNFVTPVSAPTNVTPSSHRAASPSHP